MNKNEDRFTIKLRIDIWIQFKQLLFKGFIFSLIFILGNEYLLLD